MPATIDRMLTRTWDDELTALDVRVAPHFRRRDMRDRVRTYLHGLLSGAEGIRPSSKSALSY